MGGEVLYDVSVTRNAYGAITDVDDNDGVGLDHNADFTYDGAARLLHATLGTPAMPLDQFEFGYAYDDLQNMVQRTATSPKTLGSFKGSTNTLGTNPAVAAMARGNSPRSFRWVRSRRSRRSTTTAPGGRFDKTI